jgi:hypothetical protein
MSRKKNIDCYRKGDNKMETENEGRNIIVSIIIGIVFVFFVIPAVWNLLVLLINEGYKFWFNRWGKCVEIDIQDPETLKVITCRMTRKEAKKYGIKL